MRVFFWSLFGLLAGLSAGYAAVVGGWLGYCHLAKIADRDGGLLMDVLFLLAPIGALAGGLVGAFLLAWRAARRLERAHRTS